MLILTNPERLDQYVAPYQTKKSRLIRCRYYLSCGICFRASSSRFQLQVLLQPVVTVEPGGGVQRMAGVVQLHLLVFSAEQAQEAAGFSLSDVIASGELEKDTLAIRVAEKWQGRPRSSRENTGQLSPGRAVLSTWRYRLLSRSHVFFIGVRAGHEDEGSDAFLHSGKNRTEMSIEAVAYIGDAARVPVPAGEQKVHSAAQVNHHLAIIFTGLNGPFQWIIRDGFGLVIRPNHWRIDQQRHDTGFCQYQRFLRNSFRLRIGEPSIIQCPQITAANGPSPWGTTR